jgi:glycosyltransferase involved in cell wall biosynthesis
MEHEPASKAAAMRILILNYEYPPMGGGAGRCTRYLARALVRQGVRIDILTSRYGKAAEEEEEPGLRVLRLPTWRKGIHDCGYRGAASYLLLAGLKVRSLVRENRYDLLHYFFGLPTGLLSYALGKYRDAPSVVSLRGSDVPQYDPYNRSLQAVHRVLLPATRNIWRRSARVVANSEQLRDLALRQVPGIEITVIPNAIDSEAFRPEGRKPADGRIRLLAVCRMIERKGLHVLIDAFAGLEGAPAELTLIGDGSAEGEIRRRIGERGLGGRVRMLGYLPQEDLPLHYNQADVFVLPSLAESGGEAFLEAMSCGLPVVSTTAGGIPEYVAHGEGGLLVAPGDVAGLRGAIAALVRDEQARIRMGTFNRKRILEHYSWEKRALQYLEVYREAVSG